MVVVNFNDWMTTVKYLDHVESYTCIDRIVVVDNCSTDDSVLHLRKRCSGKIDLLEHNENDGYAKGNNVGAKYLIEKYGVESVVISNPDVEYMQKDLVEILECLNSSDDIALATGVIHNYINEKPRVFSCFAWKVPSYGDMISNCFLSAYKFRRCVLKSGQYYDYSVLEREGVVDVGCVPGCFFVIKTDALENIGYFDERTFLYHEENILGYKLMTAGYRSVICTTSKIFHKEKIGKARSLKQRLATERITLDSAQIYLKHYLHCGKTRLAFYKGVYWLGRVENTVVKKIRTLGNK